MVDEFAWRAREGRTNLAAMSLSPLQVSSAAAEREARYVEVRASIDSLLSAQNDWVSAMATVACELSHAFAYFHWTGFYRAVSDDLLLVGPYQGGHGCLSIAFSRGVCGAAARTRRTQLVPDVGAFPGHIACSSSTKSEIVVPVIAPSGRLLAVLDVDSDHPAAFGEVDARHLESLCAELGARYGETKLL